MIRDACEVAEAEDRLVTPHQTLTLVLSLLTVEVKSEPVWVEGKGEGGGQGGAMARHTQACLDG